MKSLANIINMFPNGRCFYEILAVVDQENSNDVLCVITHTTETLILHFCNTFLMPDVLELDVFARDTFKELHVPWQFQSGMSSSSVW